LLRRIGLRWIGLFLRGTRVLLLSAARLLGPIAPGVSDVFVVALIAEGARNTGGRIGRLSGTGLVGLRHAGRRPATTTTRLGIAAATAAQSRLSCRHAGQTSDHKNDTGHRHPSSDVIHEHRVTPPNENFSELAFTPRNTLWKRRIVVHSQKGQGLSVEEVSR
jgi:hypothetical protein